MELTKYQERVLELLKLSRELKDYARGRWINDKLILTHYSISEWSYGIEFNFGINFNNGFGDAYIIKTDHLDTMTDNEWESMCVKFKVGRELIDHATTKEASTRARILDAVAGTKVTEELVATLESIINDYKQVKE